MIIAGINKEHKIGTRSYPLVVRIYSIPLGVELGISF
jgi:hypothetical protein